MKKMIAVLLMLCICVSLFAGCGNNAATIGETTQAPATAQNAATAEDIAALEALYTGRVASYGDTHCHSSSTTNSDGKVSLVEYKEYLLEKGIDFATIVDHGQATHMWHEDWDDTLFVGGTEPGLHVSGVEVERMNNLDYSMIFTKLEGLETVLKQFPQHYLYNETTGIFGKRRLTADHAGVAELIQAVKDNGGMWVHVHPLGHDEYGYYDPLDYTKYWFADEVGFEVTNAGYGGTDSQTNKDAYNMWVKLINDGHRIWATCGGDGHSVLPYIWILSTVYASEKTPDGYLNQMKTGNMTAGPVGIRIAVGNTATGSQGSFAGNRVVIAAGDFHPLSTKEDHTYRLDVYDETGLLFSEDISTTEMNYFAFDAKADAKYYRADVYDVTANKLLAVGNPVWNG